jgi:mRNA interferase RelE/StbE
VAGSKILLKSSVAKEIEAVGSRDERRRIVKKLARSAADPRSAKAEKLPGYDDRYRIRQGQYRIVYHIDDSHREVTIFKVGHRKDVDR